jgi:hypothetical protein
MRRKNTPTPHQIPGWLRGRSNTKGNKRTISTSKIKKITAIRKNRRENGRRDELLGSNPHSKGELFSRSTIDFLERRAANIITIVVIVIRMSPSVKIDKII